jgi:predicted RNA binding protein YcfA (HicA-like mRNA interferase family)
MKRANLVKHLFNEGCILFREGGKHSVFLNPKTRKISTVPRHKEINNFLANKICKDLEVRPPKKK